MWSQPQESDWIGAGYLRDNGSTTWSGKLVPGTYHIRMEPMGARETRLAVNGLGVHRLTALDHSQEYDFIVEAEQPDFVVAPQAVAKQPTHNPAPNPAAPTVTQKQPEDMHGQEMAMVPGRWMDVDDDEPMWFTFYVGHVAGQGTSPVSISLYTESFGGGDFQVFAAEKADPWNGGREWFGAGAENGGRARSWSGNLVPGAYYVLADAEGARTCLLAISGQAVTY
jgi:hypothetical protein